MFKSISGVIDFEVRQLDRVEREAIEVFLRHAERRVWADETTPHEVILPVPRDTYPFLRK